MDQTLPSLHSVMNSMVTRLDSMLPPAEKAAEDKDWPTIHKFLGVDPVLAQLYKQYCDAKLRLEQLTRERGSADPMSEIAADMRDSAHCAVTTRLIEIEDDEVLTSQARTPVPRAVLPVKARTQDAADTFSQMMIFMMWAQMALKSQAPRKDMRRHFRLAA